MSSTGTQTPPCTGPQVVPAPARAADARPARGRAPADLHPAGARLLRSDSIELESLPGAVPVARARTRVMLRAWDLEELVSDAESVVAELSANAVEATMRAALADPVRLTLIAGLRTLLIVVWDAVPDPPVLQDPDPAALSGRGLLIVDALSARWGWKPTPERPGKTVRALLRGTRHA